MSCWAEPRWWPIDVDVEIHLAGGLGLHSGATDIFGSLAMAASSRGENGNGEDKPSPKGGARAKTPGAVAFAGAGVDMGITCSGRFAFRACRHCGA